ncbi:kinase-like domain-containing protein [Xylaria sp. FL1042]|nr:kinase-like domain-containing protein [Xylaria sp. FL1042]
MAANTGPPRNWKEQWIADGWTFEEYRHTRRMNDRPQDESMSRYRNEWMARMLPRPGRFKHVRQRVINGVREPIWRPQRLPIARAYRNRDLLGQGPPLLSHQYNDWHNSRAKYYQTRWYFSRIRGVTVLGPLGYGGNGLVTKCQYRKHPSAAVLTFVVKIALDSWDSPVLYAEQKVTEVFNRAAHMVQAIPRSRIGLPPQRPYPYPPWYENDDSSSPESDSGDESYDDHPTEKLVTNAAMSRFKQMKADPAKFENKAKRFKERRRRNMALEYQRESHKYDKNPHPKWQADRRDFLLLEFVENGDLDRLLDRLNQENKDIPNRVLWGFWLCLTRACLAMQFPPRKFHPGRHEEHPILQPDGQPDFDLTGTGKRIGDELFEQEPAPRRRWAAKRYVHFDIDPRNILIGSFDPGARDGEHALVPKLKLADFGLTEDIKLHKRNTYYQDRRFQGKWGYYAPEQFGPEWDYIRQEDSGLPEADGPEVSGQAIAGNYGPPMNVWGIGLTMWQLITKLEVPRPLPLQMSGVSQTQMPNHYCAYILTDDKYDRVDLELRQTVAKCLAHEPKYRPQPRTLANQAKRKLKKQFPGETDDMIREWVQEVIFNPPLTSVPRPGHAGPGGSAPVGGRAVAANPARASAR